MEKEEKVVNVRETKDLKYTSIGPIKYHISNSVNGIDIVSQNAITLVDNSYRAINSGLSLDIPTGYVGIICSNLQHGGIVLDNLPRFVSSGEKEEIKFMISKVTHGGSISIKLGEKLAKLYIVKLENLKTK